MTVLPGALLLLAAEGGHDNLMLWRIVNFLILAGLLGFLARKHGGPFFAARSQTITREIEESRRQAQESEARLKSVENRLAGLDREVDRLRAAARQEAATEQARIERDTERAVNKVFALSEQEIAAAGKTARAELKAYTAQLAVALAEKKIAARMTPETQRALVGAFVERL